ncbi:MAG: hypothetical protein AVDCRST_MAG19-4287, partial [uncultured Thermomicrobiales bacterium]
VHRPPLAGGGPPLPVRRESSPGSIDPTLHTAGVNGGTAARCRPGGSTAHAAPRRPTSAIRSRVYCSHSASGTGAPALPPLGSAASGRVDRSPPSDGGAEADPAGEQTTDKATLVQRQARAAGPGRGRSWGGEAAARQKVLRCSPLPREGKGPKV